ncbi:hypothetical protein [Metabacillus iocasae]|uniref:YfhD family protein n=1 Tax=Priestia iocasae TaxID=2291674 RepID=A0ABS2QZ72_9BACI|nr:hypothetical protein [Metabacillus iocasae]MBM7704785.1 hypothetical protein [Metabacillus iocasae]
MHKKDKVKNPNKHLAHSEAKQTQLLQEEFGQEMGDMNASKFIELDAEAKARKEKCETDR